MKKFGWTLLMTALLSLALCGTAWASGDELTSITLSTYYDAVIFTSDSWAEFTYTPSETGYYSWRSETSNDVCGRITDADGNVLAEDYDSGVNHNFRIIHCLYAGATYRFGARFHSDTDTGSFSVVLEPQGMIGVVENNRLTVSYNETATLEVQAESCFSNLRYKWYRYESLTLQNSGGWSHTTERVLLGETSSVVTTEPISGLTVYRCVISDENGNEANAIFEIHVDNQLTAHTDGVAGITVSGNGTATLKVIASCSNGSLWYEWTKLKQSNGYWNWDTSEPIYGMNGDTLTTDPVIENTMYSCRVTDDYLNTQEVVFIVSSDEYSGYDNQLTIQAVGNDNVTILSNQTAELEVTASCNSGSITYQWYRLVNYGCYQQWEVVSGANSNIFTTDPATARTRYYCQVMDDYGRRQGVYFYIWIDNQLFVSYGSPYTVAVPLNGTTILDVDASCLSGGLRYQWYKLNLDGSDWPGEAISGATEDTFTVFPVIEKTQYLCLVYDDYGNTSSGVNFLITIDNQLTATAVGNTWVGVAPNATTTLEVSASCVNGSLTYRWYKQFCDSNYNWSEEELIADATGNTVTTDPVTGYAQYHCEVSDEYDGIMHVYFSVDMDNQLTVRAVGNSSRKVPLNDTVSLAVDASCLVGGLRYQWYRATRDADGYWSDTEKLNGAVSNTIMTAPIDILTEYSVEVTDDYGRKAYQDFRLSVDNGFVVQGKHRVYTIAPGSSVTLEVEATCNTGALTYDWGIEGYNEPTLTIEDITERSWYYCEVSDIYGNSEYCNFEVNFDTDLWIEAVGDTEITVPYGSDVTMEVGFGCTQSEEVSMDWSAYGWNHFSEKTESDDLTRCTLTNVTGLVEIWAQVYDDYGNYRQVGFTIYVENGFSVSPVGSTMRNVQAGEEVTLAVQATATEGGFRYEWYEENKSLEDDGASITRTVTESTVYRCYVYDRYESSEFITFVLKVGASQTIAVGQSVTVRIDTPKKFSIYEFTPVATGTYTLYSFGSTEADPYAVLYDPNGRKLDESDDMYSYSYNDSDAHCRLTARLTAGQTYQYWVSSYDTGSFTIRLIRESSGTGNGMEVEITLRTGQSVILPPLYGEIVNVISDNTDTVTVSGNAMTAVRAGNATVTAEGASGTAVYDVTVATGSVLSTPADLRVIEQNAFSGDRQVRFVTLGGHVARIDAFAFSSCGLEQIVIPADNTQIAFSAFNGVRPLIVCLPGSTAEAFAREFGYIFVYIN